MRYEIGQANRLGNRSSNQDRFLSIETPEGVLLVLADGMGGQAYGEVAAEILVETAREVYLHEPRPILKVKPFLNTIIETAHRRIVDFGAQQQPPATPGTTAVLCLLQAGEACWAHVGDSRLYVYQRGIPLYRTTDHSYVEQLFQRGEISRYEQDTHPQRNQITQCLGCRPDLPTVSFSNQVSLKQNDIVLLCSDGLWGPLDDAQLGTQLVSSKILDEALNELAERAERASYPQSDNISALALRFISSEGEQPLHTDSQRIQRVDGRKDSLEDAIAQIEEVIREYEGEIEK
jgi:PPM family protein phosphatase